MRYPMRLDVVILQSICYLYFYRRIVITYFNTPLNFQAAILPNSKSSFTIFLFLAEFGLIANLLINRSSIKALL